MTAEERRHWEWVTGQPNWRDDHIADPTISTTETVDAAIDYFPHSVERILEIGCGYGRLTCEVQKRFPEAEVHGLDVSGPVLAEAIKGPTYHRQDNLDGLPPMDAIYSVGVFQHLPSTDKLAYITQAHQLLTEGGVLTVQFVHGDHDGHLDHRVSADVMMDWCSMFECVVVERGRVHPDWSWLTAVR